METVKKVFPAAFFIKPMSVADSDINYPALSIAVAPLPPDGLAREAWFSNPGIIMCDLNAVMKDYADADPRKAKILVTHLGQGIGDMIAFSAVAEYLRKKTIRAYIDMRKDTIFRWFSNQDVRLHDFYSVIATDFTPVNRVQRYSHFARLRMEYVANEAGSTNWYDAMFQRIGLPKAPKGFDRPHLVRRADSVSEWIPKRKSILICHKASCQMRTSNFEDFYLPALKRFPDHAFFVHESDLTKREINYIIEKTTNVTIIPKISGEEYFDNLYAAAFVISTDTAAIHFREGIEKPALGVYGAFTSESRTSGYIHTKSFNPKSKCPHQPCFVHQQTLDHVCPFAKPGDTVAKCQSGKAFQQQLYEQLMEYYNNQA